MAVYGSTGMAQSVHDLQILTKHEILLLAWTDRRGDLGDFHVKLQRMGLISMKKKGLETGESQLQL